MTSVKTTSKFDILPAFEDVVNLYINYTFRKLFPQNCKNRYFIYMIGFFHILGALIFNYGLLLPNNILPLHLVFCLVNIFIYFFVFQRKCFMTLLTNYYGNLKGSALHIRMETHYNVVFLNIALCILGIIFPQWSLYSLLGSYFA